MPCNGIYKLQAESINEKPVYHGPKLESGELVCLWYCSNSSRWVFTPTNEVEKEEYTPLAFCEGEQEKPYETEGGWKIASRRPGRYLPHAGLSVSNELPDTPPPLDAIVVYEKEISWWARQHQRFKRTRSYQRAQKAAHTFKKTERVQRVMKVGETIKHKGENLQSEWDNTQNPTVWYIREKVDTISMETENGAGISMIRRDFFPDFWPDDFIDEMVEKEIFPTFVPKFLEGDMNWLRLACAGEAEHHCFASVKERMTQDHFWDQTILWYNKPILDKVLIENKKPYVRVSGTVQHVDCARNSKGEVVDGGPTKIANSLFLMTMTPLLENEELVGFPWQIHQLATQRVQALM